MAFTSTDRASFKRGNACWKIESLAKGKTRRYLVGVRALGEANDASRLTNIATARADEVHTQTAKASVKLAPAPPLPAASRADQRANGSRQRASASVLATLVAVAPANAGAAAPSAPTQRDAWVARIVIRAPARTAPGVRRVRTTIAPSAVGDRGTGRVTRARRPRDRERRHLAEGAASATSERHLRLDRLQPRPARAAPHGGSTSR